ncbi:hypothetical protein GGR28_000565 [Lewinella aquimaris]|uniref:Uncharacterized protein n=1 Tax=Neolewinella aquimaris TaxID=1835722 RepID=A0A840DXM7_9BACT|nr:DUF6364 family protein [Neolewinella aquimaris]MBB4077964.1 hypothetical protein [Neolewinella aquimaris]
MDRKLTLSLNAAVIDRAKQYARERETSLSRMIEQYLASLTEPEGRGAAPACTPLVERLVDLSGRVVRLALNDDAFSDFEDALQYYSALESGTEVIITRNQRDFVPAKLPVLSAAEYLISRG